MGSVFYADIQGVEERMWRAGGTALHPNAAQPDTHGRSLRLA